MTGPPRGGHHRVRRPGPSLRLKLAASYAGFLLVAGAALICVAFLVLRFIPDEDMARVSDGGFVPRRSDLVAELVPAAGLAMALLALIGVVGGWWLAGRVLRPVTQIAQAARQVGVGSLSHRVDLEGPQDELRELADTLDEMLERMEAAFEEQRRFAANASHELRTPLAVTRTVLEVALAEHTEPRVAETLRRLADTNDRAVATTEALLTLARARSLLRAEMAGRARWVGIDLADLVEDVLEARRGLPSRHPDGVHPDLAPARVGGDPVLLTGLVRNLVDNAELHGDPAGLATTVRTWTTPSGRAGLEVRNPGPELDPQHLATLVEPFVRGTSRVRTPGSRGSGLGLAIVRDVATAHHARLQLVPRPGGGLVATVLFPPARPAKGLDPHAT